jgi:hypothetical protein
LHSKYSDQIADFFEGSRMSSNGGRRDEADANFSFGVREMRQMKTTRLQLDTKPLSVLSESRGSDPYNSSGSFDRRKNWARVGKR